MSHESSSSTQDSRLETRDSRLKTQDSRLKTQDSRLKTQDSRLKTQDSRLKTQDSFPCTEPSAELYCVLREGRIRPRKGTLPPQVKTKFLKATNLLPRCADTGAKQEVVECPIRSHLTTKPIWSISRRKPRNFFGNAAPAIARQSHE